MVDTPPVLPPRSPKAIRASLLEQLDELDRKKVRAITDFIVTGDKSRLLDLEAYAALLRPHVGADAT